MAPLTLLNSTISGELSRMRHAAVGSVRRSGAAVCRAWGSHRAILVGFVGDTCSLGGRQGRGRQEVIVAP